jgi:ABC-2 type transport system permease protein
MGKLASGILGLLLLLSCFTAIGLYISSLTEQPGVAAIGSFGVLLLLWIIDWAGKTGQGSGGVLSWLSLVGHYKPMLLGLINSADLAYFLLITGFFLALTARQLDNQRLAP